jgi:hypothetical protein
MLGSIFTFSIFHQINIDNIIYKGAFGTVVGVAALVVGVLLEQILW